LTSEVTFETFEDMCAALEEDMRGRNVMRGGMVLTPLGAPKGKKVRGGGGGIARPQPLDAPSNEKI
jgi:hypothetical protein